MKATLRTGKEYVKFNDILTIAARRGVDFGMASWKLNLKFKLETRAGSELDRAGSSWAQFNWT